MFVDSTKQRKEAIRAKSRQKDEAGEWNKQASLQAKNKYEGKTQNLSGLLWLKAQMGEEKARREIEDEAAKLSKETHWMCVQA